MGIGGSERSFHISSNPIKSFVDFIRIRMTQMQIRSARSTVREKNGSDTF
jgi:hypothetical protein